MIEYAAILADPPWSFKTWSAKGEGRSARNHYSVMRLDDIRCLPVTDYAAKNCALFMWAIDSMLPEALEVGRAWGFVYKTVAFTWVKHTKYYKEHVGMGYWTRANPEQCLLFTRGKPKRKSAAVRQLIKCGVREHSRKPDEQYERIEALVDGPYLEMFARPPHRPGWDVMGNEAVIAA